MQQDAESQQRELAQGGILRELVLKPAAPVLCCVSSPWGGPCPRGRVSTLYSKLSGPAWAWLRFRGVSPIQPPPPGRDCTMAGSGAQRFVLSAVLTAASSSHHGDRTRRLRAPSSNQARLRAALPRLPVPLDWGSHPQQRQPGRGTWVGQSLAGTLNGVLSVSHSRGPGQLNLCELYTAGSGGLRGGPHLGIEKLVGRDAPQPLGLLCLLPPDTPVGPKPPLPPSFLCPTPSATHTLLLLPLVSALV